MFNCFLLIRIIGVYRKKLQRISVMKIDFKQWWWSVPPISTKQTVTSHLNWARWAQKPRRHDIWRWKSNPWFETCTKMWRCL